MTRPDENGQAIRVIAARLLAGIAPGAELIDVSGAPGGTKYTLHLQIPGEGNRRLILFRRAVDKALTGPAALATLRRLVQSELRSQRSRRS